MFLNNGDDIGTGMNQHKGADGVKRKYPMLGRVTKKKRLENFHKGSKSLGQFDF